jgi:2-haloacid dehalogenase
MLDFTRFRFLTFDCYGTLIDWESGIFSALRPILVLHERNIEDKQLLEMYGELELEAETGEYHSYRDVLRGVVRGFGARLGFAPSRQEQDSLPESIADWNPWPDTVAALHSLAQNHQLVILSNIDDDLFAATRPKLQASFKDVVTAQQAGCYKPCHRMFELALQRIGASPAEVLHVGQSVYHDVIPAKALGMSTVWVNRPSARPGVGAVKAATAKPDLEVPDLATLASLAQEKAAKAG